MNSVVDNLPHASCSHDGCDRKPTVKKHQLCVKHYALRWYHANKKLKGGGPGPKRAPEEERQRRLRETSKKYRDNNKQSRMRIQRDYRASFTGRFNTTKHSALNKGRAFDISFDQYLELRQQPCHYCGDSVATMSGGLDRIDSQKDYTLDNVRPCCRPCNVAKNNMPESDFRELVRKWAKNYLKIAG